MQLLPYMTSLRRTHGEKTLIRSLQRILLHQGPIDAESPDVGLSAARHNLSRYAHGIYAEDEAVARRDEVLIHRVTVTPTGLRLYGPDLIAANRILRQYRVHADCFIRVQFADEDGERIAFTREVSNDLIFQGRFLTTLQKGFDVAGFRFDFLGFSHSSLRSQTCWFMRNFMHDSQLLFARHPISQLGDFTAIHCPAKCAARIGQAFSDTTKAVEVDSTIVTEHDDVQRGNRIFTDGCGTISKPSGNS